MADKDAWLSSYYSRITEEYKISMERKDRALNWSITVFFIAFMAYAELLTNNNSIWRIYLLFILELFILRFFIGSIIAYTYLKKWRYIIQKIDSYKFKKEPKIDEINTIIDTYDHKDTTTEKARYFIKNQLKVGFGLLFAIPIVLITYEFLNNPPGQEVIWGIGFSILIVIYEILIFRVDTHPPDNTEQGHPPSIEPRGEKPPVNGEKQLKKEGGWEMFKKSFSLRRLRDLTIKWASFIGMLFFAEYSVTALLDYYKGGNQSLLEIAFLLIFFIIYSVALASLSMAYPTLQRLLDAMFGDAPPEKD